MKLGADGDHTFISHYGLDVIRRLPYYIDMKTTTQERYEAARKAVLDGEASGLGRSAMAKRYKALFAIEDEIKGKGVWL